MNSFIQQLVDDLKAFSAELLSPGLHAAQQVSSGMGTVASTTALLKAIDFLTSLVPQLVSELQTTDITRKVTLYYTPSPKGAHFSQRATDYQQDNAKRLLPAHWLTILPAVEIDVRPLRWLVYLLELQQTALTKVNSRTTKYIDDSLLTQYGDSAYADNDKATLLSMRARLNEAQAKLEHARGTLLRSIQRRLVPCVSLPYPYPRSVAWIRLRRYAQQLIHPTEYLPTSLHNLLNGTLEIADTPYLYQRWCGIKLLQSFESLGWGCYDDPTGPLYLGGEIRLYKAEVEVSLWVEPRFSPYKVHPSGFACRRAAAETHPDYFIITPGPNGVDAFILDPTTTADLEIRRSKGKYLDTLETIGMASVAGVPAVRHPLRAWSAAPLHTPYCELDDPEGHTGTIPMHPLDWFEKPLLEWTRDINNYALAWGKFAGLAVL